MTYVFDSGPFIHLFRYFYPQRFRSLWEKFDAAIAAETIISVSEAANELEGIGDRLSDWVKGNKQVFRRPEPSELQFVTDIFKVAHFQAMIRKKEQLEGKPVADPFVVAAAKIHGHCVVTTEKYRPNAAQIPNVCEHFNVECTDLEGFMDKEDWTF